MINPKVTALFSKTVGQYERFVVVMHERPDGDTIACSLALHHALKQLGKIVDCVSRNSIPTPFRFLPASRLIKSDFLAGDYEVMIVIDCGDLKRTGFPSRVKRFAQDVKRVIHIDHHQKSDLYKLANIKIFNGQASACGEIIYSLFNEMEIDITSDIATCLLTSLYYDTGAFKHVNTTSEVLKLAAQLMHRGAKLKEITENVDLTKSVSALKLWGVALTRARRHKKLGIVSSVITSSDLAEAGASVDDTAGIVNLLNSVPGIKASILIAEASDGTLKASLRTEDPGLDVSRLANLFGGGGLRRASGFSVVGKLSFLADRWHVKII